MGETIVQSEFNPISSAFRKCPPDFCDRSRPFCFEFQCYRKCPDGYVTHENQCVSECPGDAPFQDNKICSRNCPAEKPFVQEGVCVPECSEGMFINGIHCVLNCNDQHVLNGTCVNACPLTHRYFIDEKNNSVCMEQCPDFTVHNDRSCEVFCPSNMVFVYNFSCHNACPYHSDLILPVSSGGICIPVCVERCPTNYVINDRTCATKCPSALVRIDNICAEKCPKSKPLILFNEIYRNETEFSCSKSCPDGTKPVDDFVCFPVCSPGLYYHRPTNATYLFKLDKNPICVLHCLPGYKSCPRNPSACCSIDSMIPLCRWDVLISLICYSLHLLMSAFITRLLIFGCPRWIEKRRYLFHLVPGLCFLYACDFIGGSFFYTFLKQTKDMFVGVCEKSDPHALSYSETFQLTIIDRVFPVVILQSVDVDISSF